MTNMNQKMPEVGDVWVNVFSGDKITIIGVKGAYYFYGYMKDKIMVIPPFCQNKENLTWYKYLGKAIGSIDDLFKVKSFDEKQYYKDMFGEEND